MFGNVYLLNFLAWIYIILWCLVKIKLIVTCLSNVSLSALTSLLKIIINNLVQPSMPFQSNIKIRYLLSPYMYVTHSTPQPVITQMLLFFAVCRCGGFITSQSQWTYPAHLTYLFLLICLLSVHGYKSFRSVSPLSL